MTNTLNCPTCSYEGRPRYDGGCPECKHREIEGRNLVGRTVVWCAKDGTPLEYVEVEKLHRNDDGRYNGIARVRLAEVTPRAFWHGSSIEQHSLDEGILDISTEVLREQR